MASGKLKKSLDKYNSSSSTRAGNKIGELRLDPSDEFFKEQADFNVTRGQCWHVVFSPDERYFAWISSPNRITLVPWDRERNCLETASTELEENEPGDEFKEIRSPKTLSCSYPFLCVAFGISRPGKSDGFKKPSWTRFDFSNTEIVATGHANGRIRIWGVETGTFLMELISHKTAVRDLAFAPDGSYRLISASLDKTLKGWDLNEDGNMFKTFFAHKEAALWCTWSPNSKLMASAGNEKTVFIWEMENYRLTRRLEGHCHNVVSCSFSPDGAVLATASWDTQVILWDPYIGTILCTLYHLQPPPNMIYASGMNGARVKGVSYSRNGMHLATISDDHKIRFWNTTGNDEPVVIPGDEENPLSCTFSPTGRCVAVGTDKFKVSFYSAPTRVPRLTHLARMTVRRFVLTEDVAKLDTPCTLKAYLKYEMWD